MRRHPIAVNTGVDLGISQYIDFPKRLLQGLNDLIGKQELPPGSNLINGALHWMPQGKMNLFPEANRQRFFTAIDPVAFVKKARDALTTRLDIPDQPARQKSHQPMGEIKGLK